MLMVGSSITSAPSATRRARSSLACSRAGHHHRAAEERSRLEPREVERGHVADHDRARCSHAGVLDRGEGGAHRVLVGARPVADRGDGRGRVEPTVDQSLRDVTDLAGAHEDHQGAADACERVPVDVGAALHRVFVPGHHREVGRDPAVGDRDAPVGQRADRARDARHHFVGDPRSGERFGFFAAPPEHERVAALEPHDGVRGLAAVDEHRVDLVLAHVDLAGCLPGRDQLRACGHDFEQGRRREAVVHDDVGAGEHREPAHGEQSRIPRPRAHEVDGHAPTPVSRSSRPPCSNTSSATSVPTSAGSGPRREERSTMRPSAEARSAAIVISEPSACASAAHGRSQPPPSAARNARSASTTRWALESSMAATRASVSLSSPRHSTASAPCRDHRQHHRRVEHVGRPIARAEPLEGGERDDDRVEVAGLVQPGRDVAAQLCEREIGPVRGELRAAPHRAGADHCARGECVERRPDERVTRVGALGDRREHQAFGRCRRWEILGRVHRDVGAAVEHGLLHFLDEHARPTHLVDRSVGARVTRRRDDHQLDFATEQRRHAFGLPAGEHAPARRDAQRGHQASGSGSTSRNANRSANASA